MPARPPVHDDQVQHLRTVVHCHLAGVDLPRQRLIRAEQELLPRLTPRIERARNLRAAKRAVVQRARILPRKRHALRHALVDDVVAHLRQPVHVRFPGAEIAALDRVVEQPVHAVAVVAIVLRRVDAALRRHAVRAPRAVLVCETIYVVAHLAQARRRRSARQPGADHDHAELAPVGRRHQLHIEARLLPEFLDWTVRRLPVQLRLRNLERDPGLDVFSTCHEWSSRSRPKCRAESQSAPPQIPAAPQLPRRRPIL